MDAVKKCRITVALAILLFILLTLVIGFPKIKRGERGSESRPEPFKKPSRGFQEKLSEEAKSFDTYLQALKAEEERGTSEEQAGVPSSDGSGSNEGER